MAYLSSLVTAAPAHIIPQAVSKEFLLERFSADKRLLVRMGLVFDNAGVEQRRSAIPPAWYLQPQSWQSRTEAFIQGALPLLEAAARRCLDLGERRPGEIDALIFVTSSGIGAPSIDMDLIDRLGLRRDVVRMPLFGLACSGAVQGLARAADHVRAHPGSKVLLLVVELCMLSFRTNTPEQSNMIATSIFADGAAALLIESEPKVEAAEIIACSEQHWPEQSQVTAYTVENDGLGLILSARLPGLVREIVGGTINNFLDRQNMTWSEITGTSFHPGGPRILENLAESLNACPDTFESERDILRRFGNMSAPTVIFVFQNNLEKGAEGNHLLCAMGAGFTIASVLLRLDKGPRHEMLDLAQDQPCTEELISLIRAAS